MRKGRTYTFNIVNLLKPDSLYNKGMQPTVYSETMAASPTKIGWIRAGKNIRYFKNKRRVESSRIERTYYTLTFQYTFEHDADTVYFAHCYPYTYTDLQNYLTVLSMDPVRSKYCRQRVLCETLCGNVCDLLTVTQFGATARQLAARRGVVVSARVHPGESNASWMMKGFIDFIVSEHPDARTLREHFIFKIVPMLNPDGVITGNYRTGLAGVDLNRVYRSPARELYPTVYNMKLMMHRFRQDREVVLYIDFHGHSRKQNIFAYGCNAALHEAENKMKEQVFIRMLELNGPGHFSLPFSRFHVKASKESTGRVNTWRELKIMNTFTIEATFCGSTIGPLRNFQFSQTEFEQVGPIVCDTLLDYFDPDPTKYNVILDELRNNRDKKNGDGDSSDSGEEESDSGGSDSSESDGASEVAQTRYKKVTGRTLSFLSPTRTVSQRRPRK